MPLRRSREAKPRRGEGTPRTPLTLRHPRAALAGIGVFVVLLAVLGFQVQDRLSPTSLDIAGTPSYKANTMLRRHFGDTALFAILLQGPKGEIDRQGPQLVRALRAASPKVTTLSPWDNGSVSQLRPSPRKALVLADFHTEIGQAVNHSVGEVEEILEREISPPVKATQSGFPTLSRALQEETISASERDELIALPVLLIVLLLVFRSPIAAAIPLVFGAITVFTSSGVLTIITHWVGVDAFALTVCTMMGLALGVDYALLMVSRFREELAGGAEPLAAAIGTKQAAGRTVIFAGSTLMISMLVAFFVVPGDLLSSLAATVMLVVAISVSGATIAGPAVLLLLGENVNRWRIGQPPAEDSSSRLMILVGGALRRPVLVCIVVGAVVLAFATPALGLKTGPPSAEQLAHGNQARKDAELINHTISPGFDAPFILIASSEDGTITEPERLRALTRVQDKIAKDSGVQLVIGPQQINKQTTPLRHQGNALLVKQGGPAESLARLGHNLERAADGIGELRGGISEASDGAALLAEGSGGAEEGALKIASGISRARGGSEEAVTALNKFAHGAEELAKGAKKLAKGEKEAAEGAEVIKQRVSGLYTNTNTGPKRIAERLQKRLKRQSEDKVPALKDLAAAAAGQVGTAQQQLEAMTTGKTDPHYAPALDAVKQAAGSTAGLGTGLEALAKESEKSHEEALENTFWWESTLTEIKKVEENVDQLHTGLVEIKDGGNELASGSQKLANGSKELAHRSGGLTDGLTQLGAGALRLAAGIAELTEGATALEAGLTEAFHRSLPLQTGLRKATVRVLGNSRKVNRQTTELRQNSPGIFDSGYFVLSAIDGAPPKERKRAGEIVDLEHGGQSAATIVFPDYTFNTPGSIDLNKKLEGTAAELASETGLQTGVAGNAATLNDYTRVTREKIPTVIAVITLATFLIMVIILRALPLAAIAVGLNLATVAVAFGVLTLLFNVPQGFPFGGQSYIDVIGGVMIFGVVFGLSIDYAVFLLIRMRERYEEDGDNAAAIRFGLEKTARVITGAAVIMMAVFIAFATAPIANVSQLGIGLTVAVLLDATVVRIVFLPALMLLIGDRVWWMPVWMQRVIPKFDV